MNEWAQWVVLLALVGWQGWAWHLARRHAAASAEAEARRVERREAYLARLVEPKPGETPGRAMIRARLAARAQKRMQE